MERRVFIISAVAGGVGLPGWRFAPVAGKIGVVELRFSVPEGSDRPEPPGHTPVPG
jgi:hypothetical protein